MPYSDAIYTRAYNLAYPLTVGGVGDPKSRIHLVANIVAALGIDPGDAVSVGRVRLAVEDAYRDNRAGG